MKKLKLGEVFVSKYRIYLLIILILLALLCVAKPNPIVIGVSVLVYLFILFITYKTQKNKIDRIVKNINSFMLKLNTDESILDFPLPANLTPSVSPPPGNGPKAAQKPHVPSSYSGRHAARPPPLP